MNNYANVMLTMLLGWVQTAARWLWTQVSGVAEGGFLAFLVKNWVAVVAILCVVGVAVDLTVYMIRWRPYLVWASFFRRVRRRAEERRLGPAGKRRVLRWEYPDGTNFTQTVADDEESGMVLQIAPELLSAQLPQTESKPEMKTEPQPVPEEEHLIEAETPAEPVRRRRADRRAPARVNRLTRLLSAEEMDEQIPEHYLAAAPAKDKNEVFGTPYYPPQWKRPDDSQQP